MWLWAAAAVQAVAMVGAASGAAVEPTGGADWTGQQIYEAGCAACHGLDGRGVGQELVGFDEPLPDFTACSFSSREPNADWVAVVHDGGPTRGFARMMPAFGGLLSEAQITAALAHARAFCPDRTWPSGDLNFPRALFTEKAFVEDEVVVTSRIATEGEGRVSSKLVYEQRFGARNQIELIIPYQVDEGGRDWVGGLGDIALGLKRALLVNRGSGSIVSLAGEIILPTGDAERGLGGDVFVFEPFLSVGQALGDSAFIHAQVGAEIPLNAEDTEVEGFWRLALGQSFESERFGRAWTPMLEILGARDLEGGATSHWDLVPQLQVTLNTRQHVMASVGARVPVNDRAARPVEAVFYLLWDWFDGGIDEGW